MDTLASFYTKSTRALLYIDYLKYMLYSIVEFNTVDKPGTCLTVVVADVSTCMTNEIECASLRGVRTVSPQYSRLVAIAKTPALLLYVEGHLSCNT